MSDNPSTSGTTENRPYWETGGTSMLRNFVLAQMLRGAGWSALLVVAVGGGLYALYLASLLLPEESKQAPAPMGALEQPLDAGRTLA